MSPNNRGFALLECLIAILLLSVGLLGLVGLSSRLTQSTGDAENRQRAAGLADEIVTYMWMNQTNAPASASIQTVVTNWQAKSFEALPAAAAGATNFSVGGGTLANLVGGPALVQVSAPSAKGDVTVTIQWQAPSATVADTYVTTVAIPS